MDKKMDKKKEMVDKVMADFMMSIMDAFGLDYLCYERSRRGAFLVGFTKDRPSFNCGTWVSGRGWVMSIQLTKPLYKGFEEMVLASSDCGWYVRDDGKGLDCGKCSWSRELF